MIKIADIKENDKNFTVQGKITKIQKSPEGAARKWAKCTYEDKFDEILCWLWNADGDRVQVGDIVRITNGYCRRDGDGSLSISPSKFNGSIEIVKEENFEEVEDDNN